MKATTVKQVLQAARWMIENVGWCQGSYYSTKSGEARYDISLARRTKRKDIAAFCSLGAISMVEADDKLVHVAFGILNSLTTNGVPVWNDELHRTKKEVLNLFDKAIEKA